MLLRTTVRVYLGGHWFPPGTLLDVYGADSDLAKMMVRCGSAVPVTGRERDRENREQR